MRVLRRARLAEEKSAGVITCSVRCVLRSPWRRELFCAQASRRDAEASDWGESRARGAGERQGRVSSAARGFH
eukprot:6214798-Pleurochrysis_carterae.AAC.9